MSQIMKLYHSRTPRGYEGDVVDIIIRIEFHAMMNGLNLSRWQSNLPGKRVRIVYALHEGERATQFRYQEGVRDWVQLSSREGKTKRSEAYRELSGMLENLLSD